MFAQSFTLGRTSTEGFELPMSLCYKDCKVTIIMQLGWGLNEADKDFSKPVPSRRDTEKGKCSRESKLCLPPVPGGLIKEEKMENSHCTHGTQCQGPKEDGMIIKFFSAFDAVVR